MTNNALFRPDNFSDAAVTYQPADVALPLLRAACASHFPGATIIAASQLARREINSANYRVTLSLSGSEKTVLVHEYKTLQDKSQIDFYLELLEMLESRDVCVSRLHRTVDGARYAQKDGFVYAVFEFADGNYFSPSEEYFASVAKEVAVMHSALEVLPDDYRDRIEQGSEQGGTFFATVPKVRVGDLEEIGRVLEQKENLTDMDKTVRTMLPSYIRAAAEVEAAQEAIRALPKQVFHSDLHPHNILVDKERVAALVDFDSLRVQHGGESLDIAYAIYRLGRLFFVGKSLSEQETKSRARALRDMFISQYTDVRSISFEAQRLLPLLCKEEMLKKLIFLLRGAYGQGNTAWLHELPKFVVALEEVGYFWD